MVFFLDFVFVGKIEILKDMKKLSIWGRDECLRGGLGGLAPSSCLIYEPYMKGIYMSEIWGKFCLENREKGF